MTTTNNSEMPSYEISLTARMLVGAAIGVMVISFFIFGVPNPPAAWGQYWRIRPLIVVPFAGAMGGLCNHLLLRYHSRFGITKTVAILASVLIAAFGLWVGIILGLVGTMWN
jgi:hypothetical protein